MSIPHPLTGDCVALWRCDETAATDNLVDATGNGHTGVQTGSPAVQTGKFDGARGIFGTGKYIIVPDSSDFHLQCFTVAAWAYYGSSSMQEYGKIISKERTSGSHNSWALQSSTTGTKLSFNVSFTDGTWTNFETGNLGTGWHHCVAVWSGHTLSLWVDGVLVDSTSEYDGKVLYYDSGAIWIGRDEDYSFQWWNGYLDDIAVYNTAKNYEWVTAIYSGSGEATVGPFSLSGLSLEYAPLGIARKAVEQTVGDTLAAPDSLFSLSAVTIEHAPLGRLRPMGSARSAS